VEIKIKSQKNTVTVNKELVFAQDGQAYAVATKILGNRRINVKCSDGRERMAIIMGRFKGKSNWIEVGTLVLINLREYSINDDKAEVCNIYDPYDVSQLRKLGELNWMNVDQKDDDDIDLFDENIDDIDLDAI
jgi:translation initiation factor 1A